MTYKEEYRDLFSVDDSYYFAHCISADFALGAGIAKQFVKKFNTRGQLFLLTNGEDRTNYWDDGLEGFCILTDRVFNLVTKRNYWDKPTLMTMRHALINMMRGCKKIGVEKLAMPKIGCGLDKLNWDDVSELIKEIFENTNIEILVCIK